MKIALPVYLHGFGGAERQVIALANQMVDRGHEVHMLLLADDKIKYYLSEKITIHSLLYAEKGSLITKILNRRKALIKALRYLNCDVVVNFNFQSAYLLTLVHTKGIGKVIYSERGDPGDKEFNGLIGVIRRFVLHKINGYVFQSDGARDYFIDTYVRSHSTVIPNACFLKKENPAENRTKRIVTVGRLSSQKNQRLLIKAFKTIASKYPDYYLEIYGAGDLKDELVAFAHELDLNAQVKFMGATAEIFKRIKDASLFVLSSDFEGIPNALIEAMALGLPCISTDCKPGGARTLITNNVDGIITPVNDAKALADAMDYMLSHPQEAEIMAHKASEISQRLSPKVIYDKWEKYLSDTCSTN